MKQKTTIRAPLAQWALPITVVPCNKHYSPKENSKQSVEVEALIDTGALCSTIRSDFIEELGIYPFTKARMHTPSESNVLCDVYKVALVFPKFDLPQRPNLELTAHEIAVFAMPSNVRFEFLLGMNVIGAGKLICDGPNNDCTLGFNVKVL